MQSSSIEILVYSLNICPDSDTARDIFANIYPGIKIIINFEKIKMVEKNFWSTFEKIYLNKKYNNIIEIINLDLLPGSPFNTIHR